MTLEWEIFGKASEVMRERELNQPIPPWMKVSFIPVADVYLPPDHCPWDDFKLSKDLS